MGAKREGSQVQSAPDPDPRGIGWDAYFSILGFMAHLWHKGKMTVEMAGGLVILVSLRGCKRLLESDWWYLKTKEYGGVGPYQNIYKPFIRIKRIILQQSFGKEI